MTTKTARGDSLAILAAWCRRPRECGRDRSARALADLKLRVLLWEDLDGDYREVQRAEHLDPHDEITLPLRNCIEDVRAGRVEAPTSVDA